MAWRQRSTGHPTAHEWLTRSTTPGARPADFAGWPETNDSNGAESAGLGGAQFTIRAGRRASASNAYLKPVLQRPNLVVRTGVLATRVAIDGGRAAGVHFLDGGLERYVEATREVILCGGVFNSPQLLMLSGIGPADHLRRFGIKPLADLPVGRNLRDHLAVALRLEPKWNQVPSIANAARPRRGRHGPGLVAT